MSRRAVTQPIEVTPELLAWGELSRARRPMVLTYTEVALDEVLADYLAASGTLGRAQ